MWCLIPRSLDAGVEIVAQLVFEVAVQLAPQEGGDVVGLDRVNRGPHERFVQRRQRLAAVEDQVGGVPFG
jgi:hypothetical protein